MKRDEFDVVFFPVLDGIGVAFTPKGGCPLKPSQKSDFDASERV